MGSESNFAFKTPSLSIIFLNSSIHNTEDEITTNTNHVLQFKKRVDNNEPISKFEKGMEKVAYCTTNNKKLVQNTIE